MCSQTNIYPLTFWISRKNKGDIVEEREEGKGGTVWPRWWVGLRREWVDF
jgi:hypothetical protein